MSSIRIVNELVTNSIKYAFKDRDNYLLVELEQHSNMLELTIKDNGPGFNIKQTHSIGLELVDMLVHQLDGTINFNTEKGSHITISFPI